MRNYNAWRYLVIALMPILVSGCASFGRGVTQAVIDAQSRETEDLRQCRVDGEAYTGILPMLERQAAFGPLSAANARRPTTKLVYVHGIGDHQAGHGAHLARSMTEALGLNVRADVAKRIVLAPPDEPERPFGEINIIRMTDSAREMELLFFEHTWNPITWEEKEAIEFDNALIFSSQRAAINQRLRAFSNSVLPDPLAFIGNRGADIRGSVGQAICWAMSAKWQDLSDVTEGTRCEDFDGYGSRINKDDLVVVTHSLGSRATVDALQHAARRVGPSNDPGGRQTRFATELQNTQISLFMLSNQLPLLEAGQDPQEITGQRAAYCDDSAPRAEARFLKQLDMIAFTDPNDILSFPIPRSWADQYLDSRLCTNIRNITINIAHVRNIPVLGEYADPMAAHTGYDSDQRVAELIARGIGHDRASTLVQERCNWIEVDRALN